MKKDYFNDVLKDLTKASMQEEKKRIDKIFESEDFLEDFSKMLIVVGYLLNRYDNNIVFKNELKAATNNFLKKLETFEKKSLNSLKGDEAALTNIATTYQYFDVMLDAIFLIKDRRDFKKMLLMFNEVVAFMEKGKVPDAALNNVMLMFSNIVDTAVDDY